MIKQGQVLQIQPQNELKFKGPFNKEPVTSFMKLTNPSDKRVMFKIKTTAPKKYCVRPNSGILEPNSNIEIAICLQPWLFDPAEKNKHKFMVQTVFAPDGEVNLEQLWKEIGPDQLMDSKLKCVFEMPAEQNESQEEANKTAPKVSGSGAVPNNSSVNESGEQQDVVQEVSHLKEEKNQLRLENLRLKEEILVLKQTVVSASSREAPTNWYQPPEKEQKTPVIYYGIAILLALIGIIMGKFVL